MNTTLARRRAARPLQYLALAAYLVFLGFPLLWMISSAFKSPPELASVGGGLLPSNPTLQNFADALERADLLQAAWNSARVGARHHRRS